MIFILIDSPFSVLTKPLSPLSSFLAFLWIYVFKFLLTGLIFLCFQVNDRYKLTWYSLKDIFISWSRETYAVGERITEISEVFLFLNYMKEGAWVSIPSGKMVVPAKVVHFHYALRCICICINIHTHIELYIILISILWQLLDMTSSKSLCRWAGNCFYHLA